MAAAMLTIPAVDGIAKYFSGDYSLLFISWARYSVSCLLFLPVAILKHGSAYLPANHRGAHFFRTLCLVVSMARYFTALVITPMANAISAFFVGPVVATFIAVVFYGEKTSRIKSVALILGFAGVL